MKSLLAFLSLLTAAFACAQEDKPLISVEVLPETDTIAASKPFAVAVRVKHLDGWHSYWKNSGESGLPLSLTWKLPEGFTAAEPEWPAPHRLDLDSIITYTMEGEATLMVNITPPATITAGQSYALDLEAFALVCKNVCPPPKTYTASAKVTGAAAPGTPNAEVAHVFAEARKELPVHPKQWAVSAANTAGSIVLTLKPESGANAAIAKVQFFSDVYPDQVLDLKKPQELKKDGDHFTLTLTASTDTPPKDKLTGVLVAEEGWLKDDPAAKAFAIDLTFGAPPKTSASAGTAPRPAAPAGTDAAQEAALGTGTLLLFAFLGGLILNIMPCVFPVIGIKIMSFVQEAGEDRRRVAMHGLAYTAGVLVCFWVLASLTITLGQSWGGQFLSPVFVLLLCYFFMAFGLNMAGVFEVGTSAVGVGQKLQSAGGVKGSFFQGLLATVVSTPCSAPFLAPALTAATSLPWHLSLGVFTVIGIGLAAPYLVLSFAPGLVRILPRPGAWMESFKQAMSFLLFGTVGFLLWVLAAKVDESHFLMCLFGLVLVAAACWIYGRWTPPHRTARARTLGFAFTFLFAAAGLLLGWPTKEVTVGETFDATESHTLKWEPWSPERVESLRREGRAVYIDFTARWCATCQVNKRLYKDERIASLIRAKNIALLKADYTNYDPHIKSAIRETYHREAVPVNVLYVPGTDAPVIFESWLTIAALTEAFNRVKPAPATDSVTLK